MKRKHLLTMILASVLICLPCAAQNKSTKKMKITHGKEKAYTGEDVPGELKELRLTIIEDDVETTDVEMKYVANFYEVKYVKNGEKHYKMMARNRVHILESALGDMYKMEDNYQDYLCKKGPKNTEVHLGTKHEHGVFLLNGVQMTSSQFPIVGFVISFMDNELELVEPNTPFPEGKLTYFHYSNKGSMRPGGPEWTVEREADGRYKVTYFDDRGKFERRTPEKKEKVFDSKIGDDLLEIFRNGKIQNYKEEYVDPGVQDGSSWRFEVKFDSGKSIRSYGYMDGPRNSSGMNGAVDYVRKLLE